MFKWHDQTSGLLRSFSWVLGGEASSRIAALVSTFGAARVLGLDTFGLYIGILAASLMATAVGDIGLSQLLTKEIASQRVAAVPGLLKVIKLKATVLPLQLIVFSILITLVSSVNEVDLSIAVYFAILSVLVSINTSISSALRGQMKFHSASIATSIGRWLTALLVLALLLLDQSTSERLIFIAFATGLGETLTTAIALALFRKSPASIFSLSTSSISIRQSLPFAANTVLSIAYGRLDVILVAVLTNVIEYNRYAPASRIQDALYLFPAALSMVLLPYFSRDASLQSSRQQTLVLKRVLIIGLGFALPFTLGILFAVPFLIPLMLGPGYEASFVPTRILIWSLPFGIVGAPIIAKLASGRHPEYTTWVFAASFATSLGMHLLLDRQYGASGAAVASLSRDPVAVTVASLLLRRSTLEKGPIT